jgi:hypothetical protein
MADIEAAAKPIVGPMVINQPMALDDKYSRSWRTGSLSRA